MSFPRFFDENLQVDVTTALGTEILLRGDNAHHASKVLRMSKGEQLVLSNGDGREYICEVMDPRGETVRLRLLKIDDNRSETMPQIVLWQGLPKGAKFDEIIEKSVELGVHRIVPLKTTRSIVKLDERAAAAKQVRWQKISEAAAKQSGRGVVPKVSTICNIPSALAEIYELYKQSVPIQGRTRDIAFIAWEEVAEPNLRDYVQSFSAEFSKLRRIHFFVGPEGGFSKSEAELIKLAGVTPLSLGQRILRTETAGPAVLAMLNVLLPGRM